MAPHSAPAVTAGVRGKIAPGSPPQRLWEAIRANVFTNGYVNALADRVGCEPRDLYRVATDPENRTEEHRHMLARWIVPITLGSGRFDILDYMEAQVGRIACLRPAPALVAGALVERIAGVTTEVADVQITGAALLIDGITPAEAGAIDQQITEAQAALEALRLSVRDAVKRPLARAGQN